MQQPSSQQLSSQPNDPQGAISADDQLLKAPPGLPSFDEKYFDAEYRECSANSRHAEQIRASIMQFWATFTGILFVAIGVSLSLIRDNPLPAYAFMATVSFVGCWISAAVYWMERREMDYYAQWMQRCRILEVRAGFFGQYWRTYLKLVAGPEGRKSRVRIMRLLYIWGIIFWAAATALAITLAILWIY